MLVHYLGKLFKQLSIVACVLAATSSQARAQLSTTAAWPMFQHDLHHTGRSPNLGPLYAGSPGAPSPADINIIPLGNRIKGQPAIDANGILYVPVGWKFCAVNPATPSFHCQSLLADISPSSPAIDVNGFVYFGDRNNSLNGFDPGSFSPDVDPNVVCRYNHGHEGDIWSSPAVGPDGTVYFAQGQSFYGMGPIVAINPAPNCGGPLPFGSDSGVKWQFTVGISIGSSSPAIVTEDSHTFLYIGDNNGYLHKLQDDGTGATEAWKTRIGTNKVIASPVVVTDGTTAGTTIFIGANKGFAAVKGDGTLLDTFTTVGGVNGTAAIGTDGSTVYVGSNQSGKITLYAFFLNGSNKLTLRPGWPIGPIATRAGQGPFPVVASDGVVYVSIGAGVYAFDSGGTLLWNSPLDTTALSHPAIGDSTGGIARLYVTTSSGKVYEFSSSRP